MIVWTSQQRALTATLTQVSILIQCTASMTYQHTSIMCMQREESFNMTWHWMATGYYGNQSRRRGRDQSATSVTWRIILGYQHTRLSTYTLYMYSFVLTVACYKVYNVVTWGSSIVMTHRSRKGVGYNSLEECEDWHSISYRPPLFNMV